MTISSLCLSRGRSAGGLSYALRIVIAASLALAAACLAINPARAVTIDWATVGDPGNVADETGFGAVSYQYQIGKYEVTIGQYAEFLNAVAKSDPYGLYNEFMGSNLNVAGISRSGESGSYTYSVIDNGGNSANRPITYVSWYDAARFANWMQNGQGSGDTEAGSYTIDEASGRTAPRNPGAQFFIPTQNEWYKAAFYKGNGTNAGYWLYATQSDSEPGNAIGNGANQANYYAGVYAVTQSADFVSDQNYLTDVGAFTGNPSYYGTFDQSGNVEEWSDRTDSANDLAAIRGGNWMVSNPPSSYNGGIGAPSFEYAATGFRLAYVIAPSAVPEIDPAGMGSALAFVGGALSLLERRRKQSWSR